MAKKNKVISLAGCEQIFKELNVPKEIYSDWNIIQIFDFAEILQEKYEVEVKETTINIKDLQRKKGK